MRFEIRHPNHREEVFSDSDFVVFGRDPSCDVVIKDPRCSRRHASLRVIPDGFNLLDMGSANGIYVLGQKVEDAIIREGDVFSMGSVFVRVMPDDIPATLAMLAPGPAPAAASAPPPPTAKAPVLQKRPLPPAPPKAEREPRGLAGPFAPRILGACSMAIGVALVLGPLAVARQIGPVAYVISVLGILSAAAGLGRLGGFPFARALHYGLFSLWIATCLMAPFGVIGVAYQVRGEDHPETDTFFAVVIGIAGALAVIAVVVATFLARLYVPLPLPV